MGVYGALFWVSRDACENILSRWGWVGMSEGEWGWVHCLIMPVTVYCVSQMEELPC